MDGAPPLALEQLEAALHLSTMWAFGKVRDWTIKEIEKLNQSPIDRLELAQKCAVQQWLLPAYIQLCTRPERLTIREAERLGLHRYHILAQIREQWCSGSVQCSSCTAVRQKNNTAFDIPKALLESSGLGFE